MLKKRISDMNPFEKPKIGNENPFKSDQEELLAKNRYNRISTETLDNLRELGLRFDMKIKNIISQIDSKKDITASEKEELHKITKKILYRLAEAGLRKDVNVYMAFKVFSYYGDIDQIKKRLAKGCTINGKAFYDLVQASLNYEMKERAEEALQTWINDKNELLEFDDTTYIQERLYPIEQAYTIFARKNDLPEELPFFKGKLTLINAAMELKKQKPDLVIGVLNSGIEIARLLDFLGESTMYLEWHKDWEGPPVRRNIGGKREPLKTEYILLNEHDVHTGETLKALVPVLKKLNPKNIDIVVQNDENNTLSNFNILGFYSSIKKVEDIPKTNLIKNLNHAAILASQYLKIHASDKEATKEP